MKQRRPARRVRRLNCWEYSGCGREPGGAVAVKLGVCPAATAVAADGVNGGKNGGRVCWAIAGTLCGGRARGTAAAKLQCCLACEFAQLVLREEESDLNIELEIRKGLL